MSKHQHNSVAVNIVQMLLDEDLRRQLDTLTDRIRDEVAALHPAGPGGVMPPCKASRGALPVAAIVPPPPNSAAESRTLAPCKINARSAREGTAGVLEAGRPEVLVPVRDGTGPFQINAVRAAALRHPSLPGR